MRLLGVVGWKDSGKTTLIVRLIQHFVARGLRVGSIKHAHHPVELDRPGKDSYKHAQAGAQEVILASAARWALFRELGGAPEPSLDDLVQRMAPCDLVLVEGFKEHAHPKIEVHRAARGAPLIAPSDPDIFLIATDAPLGRLSVPIRPLDDVEGIAAQAALRLGL